MTILQLISTFLCFILILFGYVYVKLVHKYSYWQRRGYPFIPPHIIFGNLKQVILRKVYSGEEYTKLYRAFKPFKVGGFYRFFVPSILVTDPELIKICLSREFESFHSRGTEGKVRHEPIRCHLINLECERWRRLKRCLTPAFSITKLRHMTPLMYECGLNMNHVLNEMLKRGHNDIELQDITSRYSIDVIGTCAFGLQLQSLTEENSKFRHMGKQIFRLSKLSILKVIISVVAPNLYNLLRLRLVSTEVTQFFTDVVEEMVAYREKHNITRNDFLGLLIQLKHQSRLQAETGLKEESEKDTTATNGHTIDQSKDALADTEITSDMMAAQCFVFFIAGYETSSATLSFCLYELALNPEVQSKLQGEIDTVMQENSKVIPLQTVLQMHYLDKVVLETLRKYPPIGAIIRKCNKRVKIPGSDLTIEPNEKIVISSYALHHDPDIYPNPEIFDPERFDASNKASRHHFSYLPFGEGPRSCIGRNFGLIQVKIGLICLLSRFNFRISPKTTIPVRFDPKSTIISSKDGITLEVTRRFSTQEGA